MQNYIKVLRKKAQLTQSELARLADTSQPQILRAEKGANITMSLAVAISRALRVPLWEVFPGVEAPFQTGLSLHQDGPMSANDVWQVTAGFKNGANEQFCLSSATLDAWKRQLRKGAPVIEILHKQILNLIHAQSLITFSLERVDRRYPVPFFALLSNGTKIDLAGLAVEAAGDLAHAMRDESNSFFALSFGNEVSREIIPSEITMLQIPVPSSSGEEKTPIMRAVKSKKAESNGRAVAHTTKS